MAMSVVELAQQVLDGATRYERYFADKGLPAPSLGPEAFPEPALPPEVLALRERILLASTGLQDLVRGPTEVVRNTATYHPHFGALQALSRFDLTSHVPADGGISYTDVSAKCGLRRGEVKRLFRYAMSCNMFYEPQPDHVAHNGPSKALAENNILHQWFGMVTEELWPAATRMTDALQKWPGSDEKTETGFQLAHNTTKSLFAEVTSDPKRAKRFGQAMSLFSTAPGFEVSRIVETYPWAQIKGGAFTLVDVGGSAGTVDMALARAFPQANFVVQDISKAFANTEVPDDLQGRVSFAEHDFFTPQTARADVFFFRWIFHDWADNYCVKILKALIPALVPGTKIVLNEFCLPQPGEAPAYQQRIMRSFDMTLLSIQNAKERALDDWRELFEGTDQRFKFCKVHHSEGSPMALIEFEWSG